VQIIGGMPAASDAFGISRVLFLFFMDYFQQAAV